MPTLQKSPDAVVFDLGGVIVDWQPRYVYQHLFTDKDELDYFLKEVCNGPWMLLTDGGSHDWPTATAELAAKFPQYRSQIEAFRPRWSQMLRGEIAESVEILKRPKKRRFRNSCGLRQAWDRGPAPRDGRGWRCGSARGCGSRTPSP